LDRPAGLALDATGRLLIAEEQAGRLLRLETLEPDVSAETRPRIEAELRDCEWKATGRSPERH